MRTLDFTGAALPLPAIGNLPPTVHLFEQRDVDAVNAALAAGRPLLVRGEPGTGKSQLARAAAQGLGRALVSAVIDARTEARDLQWRFDAVRRLADAQLLGARPPGAGAKVEELLDELRYVTPGPLWWAFAWGSARDQAARGGGVVPALAAGCSPDNGTVLLLDEIDKADSSVPNGLLECLGLGRFPGPGGTEVACSNGLPLVVITTNEERALPDAFLRRCLVLQLRVPSDRQALLEWLLQRGTAHFRDRLDESVLVKAAEQLADDRAVVARRGLCPPGGAEYLDLLTAVARLGRDATHQAQLIDRLAELVLQKHPDEERR